MAVQGLKYHKLVEKIIGCAMKVHRYFGPGFPEIVYKKALMIELTKLGILFKEEVDNAETNQVLNYLRVFKIEVGLLVNFGAPSLFFKRYIYTVNN